jgi:flagella basal body P-ring formation protein FlgA
MNKHSSDTIVQYVNGTLPHNKRLWLEEHLEKCESCYTELEEWRIMAIATKSRAQKQAVSLPPLSLPIEKNRQNGRTLSEEKLAMEATFDYPTHEQRPQRLWYSALTAVLTIVVVGLMMTMFLNGKAPSPNFGAGLVQEATNTPTITIVTRTPLPTREPTVTQSVVVITSTPFPIPTPEINMPADIAAMIPNGMVAVSIPRDRRWRYQSGDRINISSPLLEQQIEDALVVFVGSSIPYNGEPSIDVIIVAVEPHQALQLVKQVEMGAEMLLVIAPTTIEMVVAAQIIPRGEVITSDMVTMWGWPIDIDDDYIGFADYIVNENIVIGQIAKTDILPHQPILASMITEDENDLAEITDYAPIAPAPSDTIEIVTAKRDISAGEIISETMVRLRPWPLEAAPFNAITNIHQVIGTRATTDIYLQQPVLSSMLTRDMSMGDGRTMIPDGMVAVSIPLDNFPVQPVPSINSGDHLTIVITLCFTPLGSGEYQEVIFTNLTPGSDINLDEVECMSQVSIKDALVVSVGEITPDSPHYNEESENQNVMIVAVSSEESLTLKWYIEAEVPMLFINH